MRNLSLVASAVTPIPNGNVTATALDLDGNILYVVSERQNIDGELEIEVWKLAQGKELVGEGQENPEKVTVLTAIANSPASPQIVSLQVILEVRSLAIILRGGDITMMSLDDNPIPEVEGSFDSGILAASWSPDESLLALVTGEEKLILMTSTFEVVSEAPLHTKDFGEDAPINVGWGSKQTQFHGSLGKSAAQAPTSIKIGSSPDDDGLPRISWRGDGAFFVISAQTPELLNELQHRVLRVYDRQAALQSTSEAVPGLEHVLCWRPSGNLIAGTQRFGFEGGGAKEAGKHEVVFFERNGLRHGEFNIRVEELGETGEVVNGSKWGYKIRELCWSSDSNILALWIEKDNGDIVQLWTMGNYHWYLKQEIVAPSFTSGQPGHFSSIHWHPELASHMILTAASCIIQRTYTWETIASSSQPPYDSGTVAVFDGSKILLTPFRTQNIPPPMSSYQLATFAPIAPVGAAVARVPIHASLSPSCDILAVLWETGYLEIWVLRTRLGPGSGSVMDPLKSWSGFVHKDRIYTWRQIILQKTDGTGDSWSALVLGSGTDGDVIDHIQVQKSNITRHDFSHLPSLNYKLINGPSSSFYQGLDGKVYHYDFENAVSQRIAQFPEKCVQAQSTLLLCEDKSKSILFVGLGRSSKLYVTFEGAEPRILSSGVTSFTIASGFVIYTTSVHEVIFAPIDDLNPLFVSSGLKEVRMEWPTRKVERGSRIVVAVPSTMSLVLQMPRGNLETISPRPLVMEVVKSDLDAGKYRQAFFACRKHRIDLNIIVDHNPEKFFERVPSFVEQIHEVDHLNLFLTLIGRGAQASETITKLCDAIRAELENKNLTKYINTILTAHVVKTPPNHEAGLALLLRLRESDPSLVEDAVKYIIFLVDADSLFDTALGMYDFSLVLMIAQHAQKDPREYLPFLRELRTLDKFYQRYRIDDHLKRHQSALRNLSLAGPERFDEVIAYIERYQLYEASLLIYKNTEQCRAVLDIYGDWLFERREFSQAAAVFVQAQRLPKAMVAYERALQWQELFDLAFRIDLAQDEIKSIGYRVAEELASKKRHAEAGRVLLDYSKDVREAVVALVQGNGFSEARRIVSLNSRKELIEDIIHPAAFESRSQMTDDISEMRGQLQKQLDRIRELRLKKVNEPDSFYGTEDMALHNVDVMTDVSMPASQFTRYTVAPTTASRSSKRSSRSKRKLERKAGSGRKGTADEEEYLLKSITKLIGRFSATQDDARNLLPHLSQFTDEHRQEGSELQEDLKRLEEEIKGAIDEIWASSGQERDTGVSSQVEDMTIESEERTKMHIDAINKVPKPELPRGEGWKMKLFELW